MILVKIHDLQHRLPCPLYTEPWPQLFIENWSLKSRDIVLEKKHELIHCKTFKILQFCSCHQLVLFAVVLQRGLTEIERFITRWYEKSCRFNYIRLVRLQNHSFIHQITVSAICKNAKFICVYIFIDVNGSEWKCSTAKCL